MNYSCHVIPIEDGGGGGALAVRGEGKSVAGMYITSVVNLRNNLNEQALSNPVTHSMGEGELSKSGIVFIVISNFGG